MSLFHVHVRLGDRFEDLYIRAVDEAAAVAIARRLTSLRHPFARFVV